MLASLRRRGEQVAIELRYIRRAVESLTCNLYHLSRVAARRSSDLPFIVVTDRRSIEHVLRVCVRVRALPRFLVRVVRSYEEAVRFIDSVGREDEEPSGVLVMSRLVYARYYHLFQPLRSTGRLIVV